jgi:hypothetical protein
LQEAEEVDLYTLQLDLAIVARVVRFFSKQVPLLLRLAVVLCSSVVTDLRQQAGRLSCERQMLVVPEKVGY